MNILLVSSKYPPEYAGSGLRAHNTYLRLQKKFNVNFQVLTSSITENSFKKYKINGISVTRIAKKTNIRLTIKKSDYFIIKFLKKIINKLFSIIDYWLEAIPTFLFLLKNDKYIDVIHIFGETWVTAATITYAKFAKKPFIVELVNLKNSPHQYEPVCFSLLLGKFFSQKNKIICISKNLEKICLEHGYQSDQIWCRPNPIDESCFNFNYIKKRSLFPFLSEKDILLLHLAKFIPRKKQLFVVNLMQYLPENYKLILAGPIVNSGPLKQRDNEYYQKIKHAINSLNLKKRVFLLPGFINNPQDYIKEADIFLLPSTIEAFGTPVFEAIACGVPAVTNDIPNVFDQWIKNGYNGYICKLDYQLWVEKIQLAAKFDRETMKKASNEILKSASTDVIDRKYFQLLRSMKN